MSAYAFGLQSKHPVGCLSHDGEHCRYDSVPVELKALRAWLPFRIERRLCQDNKPKKLKVPYNRRPQS